MNAMTIPGLDYWLTAAPSNSEPTAFEVSNRAREVRNHWERDKKRHLDKFTEALLNLVYDDPLIAQLFDLHKAKDTAQMGHVMQAAIGRELQRMAEDFATDDLNGDLGPHDERIPSTPENWT